MKYGILVCIICLILIGTASAATINSAIVKQTIQQPGVAAATLHTAAITFDSNVHGATVYLDGALVGSDEAHSKTPVTDNEVTAGDHTATFRLAGYHDSVMNFHVDAGRPQTMYAQLQQSLRGVVVRKEITREVTLQMQNITIRPVTIATTGTATPPTTQSTIICPDGYTCISEVKAKSEYGAGNYTQYSSPPCGYEPATSQGISLTKYCFKKKAELARIVSPDTLVKRQDVGKLVPDIVPNPPVEPLEPFSAAPPVRTNIVFVDKFLDDFIGGIFGHNVAKPPVNGSLAGPTIPPGGIFLFDSYTVAPVIDKGATVYIGEQGLDVTRALFEASGSVPPANNNPPNVTAIGWWASPATIYTTSPSKTIDLGIANRYRSMTVAPADFVGYAGNWYLLNWSGNRPWSTDAVVFNVQNPELDLSVKNAASLASIEGTTVTKGTQLRFSITKNMAVKNPLGVANYRSPLAGTRDDGFLDIVVVNPSGTTLTDLDVTTSTGIKTTESLRKSCWDSTLIAPNCNPTYTWDTGATIGNGTAKYQSGTYTVQVISKLNNMQINYKNGGLPYTGKTVSQKVTFTLV